MVQEYLRHVHLYLFCLVPHRSPPPDLFRVTSWFHDTQRFPFWFLMLKLPCVGEWYKDSSISASKIFLRAQPKALHMIPLSYNPSPWPARGQQGANASNLHWRRRQGRRGEQRKKMILTPMKLFFFFLRPWKEAVPSIREKRIGMCHLQNWV